MLSVNTPKPLSLFKSSTFLNLHPPLLILHHTTITTTTAKSPRKPISATLSSSSSPPPPIQQVYQPFRPPPSPLPSQFRSLDAARRLEILANRLGLWFEYAPLIPSLVQEGFTPSSIEESTGISGVEQNRLVVAAQVRDSLIQSNTDPETLSFFETGGAELLYEIRLLSVTQRAAAARFAVQKKLDAKGAQDLARAMKDFPRRRGDKGWESFDYTIPGDCLSFMYYRQSREHINSSDKWRAALELALEVAESEKAKKTILHELEANSEGKKGNEGETGDDARVLVVRMKIGEVAEATKVVTLPVCRAEEREREVLEAPWECKSEGEFGVVVAEKGWNRWVVLPGWEPVARLGKGGVVVAFGDARALPWKANRWYKEESILVVAFGDARALPWKANRWYKEESILVVADRGRKEVMVDDGFYLAAVGGGGGRLKVERGSALKEMGVKESLATVVLVVRPPREETDNQLSDEDWE